MHRSLERCRTAVRAALVDISQAEAEASANNKWSIADIVEHLDLAYTRTTAAVIHRLERGTPLERRPMTARHRVGRLLVLRLGSVLYPTGREAPATIVPKGRRFAEVSAVIEPHLLVLDQRLKQAARAFGVRTPVVNHPFLGPCSVADWRRFHWAHTRHHLKQIRSRKSDIRGSDKT